MGLHAHEQLTFGSNLSLGFCQVGSLSSQAGSVHIYPYLILHLIYASTFKLFRALISVMQVHQPPKLFKKVKNINRKTDFCKLCPVGVLVADDPRNFLLIKTVYIFSATQLFIYLFMYVFKFLELILCAHFLS